MTRTYASGGQSVLHPFHGWAHRAGIPQRELAAGGSIRCLAGQEEQALH